MPGSEN